MVLKNAKQHLVFLLFSKYFCIKLIRVSVILLPAHEKVFIFAVVTKEVAAAFLCSKLTDKVADPMKNRKFAACYSFYIISMADLLFVMATLLPVLEGLLFMVEIVYYVVKTVKELS